jgi:ParB family transcriptional regulator, chromosome partitioning protein
MIVGKPDMLLDVIQAITRTEIDASRSRLVHFVGLDVYEAAGGYVRRDLFSDDENAGYIADAELLQRLTAAKLNAAAKEIGSEVGAGPKRVSSATCSN